MRYLPLPPPHIANFFVHSFAEDKTTRKLNRLSILICCYSTAVHNLGYMYPWGYTCLSEGVHLRLAIEGKNIFTCCLFSNFYTYRIYSFYRPILIKGLFE